ncbi:mycothiol system anti-sigma-R factor [Silvibacterium bohemicum]|uniref:Mycothiol system anti-sigma-R factor n=1 Tax=Silvibacterium bohemicum TaxID=1577686 RepID=A0A841JQA7_9BACT|nr:mycothiol system anti-sigma-R factor [Silvibacterium bohemicum]
MQSCNKYSAKIGCYLDNELTGEELENFSAHLAACQDCRERLYEEQELSRLLRQHHPLYSAPAKLRNRVLGQVLDCSDVDCTKRCRIRCSRPTGMHSLMAKIKRLLGTRVACVAAAIILCLGLLPSTLRRVSGAGYDVASVTSHLGCLSGCASGPGNWELFYR